MSEGLFASFLYGVNIPHGVRLVQTELRLRLADLPHGVEFVRLVGDVDNLLFKAEGSAESSLRKLLGKRLDVNSVVISISTLTTILHETKKVLHSLGLPGSLPDHMEDHGIEWELGLVLTSEPIPSSVQGAAGLFSSKKNVVAIKVIAGRALLFHKRRSTDSGSRIMFGSTVIQPWARHLRRNGVTLGCMTSRSLGRIEEAINA